MFLKLFFSTFVSPSFSALSAFTLPLSPTFQYLIPYTCAANLFFILDV